MATSRISYTTTLLLIVPTRPVAPIIAQVLSHQWGSFEGRVCVCARLLRTMKAFAREWSLPHCAGVFWERLLKE